MSQSGSRDFNFNRNDIIEQAVRLARLSVDGVNRQSAAQKTLNTLVQSWQAKGVFLWAVTETPQALTQSTISYTLSTNIIAIEDGSFLRRDSTDTPLNRLSRAEYKSFGTKSTESMPTSFWFDRQLTPTISFYPAPENSTDVAHLQVVQRLQDFDASSDNPDFPSEWLEAMKWGLAAQLAYENEKLTFQDRLDYNIRAKQEFKAVRDGTAAHGNARFQPRQR